VDKHTIEHDALLAKQAARGDDAAFEALMVRHQQRIYNISLRMMGNRQDALEASQEAMIKIWRNLGSFKGNSAVSTWIYRVTVNACKDILRKRKIPQVSVETLHEQGFDIADGDAQYDSTLAAEDSIARALMQLPTDRREVLVLRDIHGFSYQEIAQMLSCPLGTVRSRLSRARKELKAILSSSEQNR